MRCPHCDRTISQKDRFCRHCGKAVTPDDIQASRLREDERLHGQLANQIVARCEPADGTWGAHIYNGDSGWSRVRSRPRGCPEWVPPQDWDRWFHEGLVVWDNANQRIGSISSADAVQLIETVLSNDDWKTDGIPVIERITVGDPPPPTPPRRSRKKAPEPETPSEPPRKIVQEDERLRLKGAAAEEFKVFLRSHEALLRRLAAEREQRAREVFQEVWKMLFRAKHEKDAKEIELAGRAFPWQRQGSDVFVADVPPARATIRLMENGIWWQPIIERRGHFKSDYRRFGRLEEALTWAEAEIPRLRWEEEEAERKREEERAADLARVAALDARDLTPFWIEPAALEPDHITYRAYIELEYEPAVSEKHEISFGEFWQFEKQFFSAAQLAAQLRLDLAQVDIQQLTPALGLYRIYSRVTYPDTPLAADQAQQIWSQSAILQRFAEKKVERARFGYQETETEYCVWLGWVEHKPWPYWTRQESRPEYMKEQALEETLSNALDVSGYRKHFQMGYGLLSDENLLWKLHNQRSQSKYAPAHLRAESQQWLQEHLRESSRPRSKTQ